MLRTVLFGIMHIFDHSYKIHEYSDPMSDHEYSWHGGEHSGRNKQNTAEVRFLEKQKS